MKKIKIFYLILLLCIGNAFANEALNISGISILNKDFKKILSISEKEKINKIEQLWNNNLVLVDELPNYEWDYKLDIISSTIGGRWLYNSNGYIAKLNYQLKPMYKITKPYDFKKEILGL